MAKLIIGLDNGHGEETPGKRSPVTLGLPQLMEWASNRDFVKRISEGLKRNGIPYKVLVPENKDISISERVKRAKEAGCSLIVSIHTNSGGGTGCEAIIYEKDESGAKLGKLVNKHVSAMTGLAIRSQGIISKIWINGKQVDSGLCRQGFISGMTTIIAELAFHDNKRDLAFLRSDSARDLMADGVVRGICEFTKTKYKPA
jgi:N-acetylmuramoyl-L-alanine amidase